VTALKVVIGVYHPFEIWNYPDAYVDRLRSRFPEVEFVSVRDEEALRIQIVDADVLVSWRITKELLERAPRLEWIHSAAAGVNRMLFSELVASNVIVTNSRGFPSPNMSSASCLAS
jgi:phosphoglycerate dehydrogenase-like enzyme